MPRLLISLTIAGRIGGADRAVFAANVIVYCKLATFCNMHLILSAAPYPWLA
jgi:hypothetical protein